jgi:hypothetical protein
MHEIIPVSLFPKYEDTEKARIRCRYCSTKTTFVCKTCTNEANNVYFGICNHTTQRRTNEDPCWFRHLDEFN